MKKRSSNWLGTLLFVGFLVAGWWFLAPPQLGGKTWYAVTSGVSMQPHFHAGDLVLLREQSSYHVGEVVGYHSHELHRNVMHRIVRINGSHYYFKGDNNSYIDPEHPVKAQLFGREWLRIPGFGAKLETLHKPRNAAILAAVAALFVLVGGGESRRRRRRSRRHLEPGRTPAGAQQAPPASATAAPAKPSVPVPAQSPHESRLARATYLPHVAVGVTALGLAAVAALSVIGALAYSSPPQRVVTQTRLWTETGRFSYSAPVPVGAVYDHTPLKTGDAVFFAIVQQLGVGFDYSIKTTQAASFSGRARLDAVLSDGNGWTHRIPLERLTTFTGTTVALQGTLDLAELQTAITRFEKRTDTTSSAYHVTVEPWVRIDGAVQGTFIHEQFSPTLQLDLTNGRLRITEAPGQQNSIVRTKSGTGRTTAPQHLSGTALGISEARHVAKIGIPIAVLLALLGGALFLMARNNDEVADIRRRYGPWMIDVAATERPPHVERRVESMDALARIAERYERLILHEQRDRLHSYLVEEDGVVYRYDASEKHAWRPTASTEAAPQPVASGDDATTGDGS